MKNKIFELVENRVTILRCSYADNTSPDTIEVFRLWYGAERRADDIIHELGDVEDWVIDNRVNTVTAYNEKIGVTLCLFHKEVNNDGGES